MTNIHQASLWAIPWLAFLTGLGGSLHCAGMCGGLTLAASGEKKSGIFLYQIGRVISYVLLGLLSGWIGSKIQIHLLPKNIFIFSSLFMSLFFIYWGVIVWKKKSLDISLPAFAKNQMNKSWKYVFSFKNGSLKSIGLGSLSIFLPCGFLYGAVFAVSLLQSPILSALAMMAFWLGTVPSLVIAPSIIRRFLNPLAQRVPRLTSVMLISFGIGTIIIRMIHFYGQQGPNCH